MELDGPVTITQVAARAGVHVSTVSRALDRTAGRPVTERMMAIRRIAEEMGYVPNPAASSLRTKRTGVIGVLVPRLTDYVLARIYEGIDQGCHDAGLSTFVASTNDDPQLRTERIEKFLARRVDGVVIGDARLEGDELVGMLHRRGIPYVLVNRRLGGHPSVTTDDVLGGTLAAEHLLAQGHERAGVIAGMRYASTCVERTNGFAAAFASKGYPLDDSLLIPSTPDTEGGYRAALDLLDRAPDLTAIFAINDFAAIGAMGAAREVGRAPGKDLAVIGYNDIPLCAHLPVALSSVRARMFEMGYEGARTLSSLMRGARQDPRQIAPTFAARESTVAVRIEGCGT